jgi:YidC/Oxa1 family membrane protein insertase
VLDPLVDLIAKFIVAIHEVTQYVGGFDSGASWALAIVLLTVAVRILLFPLFVKQIRSQRKMTELQPKIKELQALHKGDKQTLNAEMMKLYKEQGANPIGGCLPLILQMPIFFSLFNVLRDFAPKALKAGQECTGVAADNFCFVARHGIDAETVASAGSAKIFGAPISSAFWSGSDLLAALDATPLTVKIVTMTFIVFMGLTTFISQKQMMAKNGPVEGQAATQQKVLLYVMPFMLAIFGINVALGVLVYWTTTNLWSMAQQRVVLARMGDAAEAAKAAEAGKPLVSPTPPPGYKPRAGARSAATGNGASPAAAEAAPDGAATPKSGAVSPKSGPARQAPANRSKSNKKGQRRGGRR